MPEEDTTINWKLLNEVTFKILRLLSDLDKRFTDLEEACPNEGSRSKWIKELENAGWISSYTRREKKRNFSYYKITTQGNSVLQILIKLRDILEQS